MSTMPNFDPVQRLRASLTSDDARVVAIMERVKGEYLSSPWDDELRRMFEQLLRMVVTHHLSADASPGPRRETRALVVVGEEGTGKTESLAHLFRNHPSLPGYGTAASGCPLVTVSVPSPCTLRLLGVNILRAVGYPVAGHIRENLVWDLVWKHLPLAGVVVIHLDEMHNLTDAANVAEIDKIRKTLKSLMVSPTWPVGLVISGLPSIVAELREIGEIRRRGRFLQVPLLDPAGDRKTVEDVVKDLATIAGLEAADPAASAIAPRLLHASMARFGIMVELVHEAIEIALGAHKALDIGHFATAYADRTGVGDLLNPFVTPRWHELDCTLVLLDEIPEYPVLPDAPPERKSRKWKETR